MDALARLSKRQQRKFSDAYWEAMAQLMRTLADGKRDVVLEFAAAVGLRRGDYRRLEKLSADPLGMHRSAEEAAALAQKHAYSAIGIQY